MISHTRTDHKPLTLVIAKIATKLLKMKIPFGVNSLEDSKFIFVNVSFIFKKMRDSDIHSEVNRIKTFYSS